MAKKKINSNIAAIYCLVIVAIFPLVFHDYYFDILDYKTDFYYWAVIIFAVVLLIFNAAFLVIMIYYRQWEYKNIRLRSSDWAVLAFLFAAIISTLQSEFLQEALWGSAGRFSGLILIIAYAFTYFTVSRSLKLKQWYLDAFLLAGMAVCIIGILQYFKLDPMGFKQQIDPRQYAMFTSTIGNINTYTSYVSMLVGVSAILASIECPGGRRTWYLLCFIISLFALITGISDSAYLALIALVGIFPLYFFKNMKGIGAYTLILAVLCSEFWIINWIIRQYPGRTLEIHGLFQVVAGYSGLFLCVILLWGIYLLLYYLERVLPKEHALRKNRNIYRWCWLFVLAAAVFAVTFSVLDVNIWGNTGRYGLLSGYLKLDDSWGTHRWYIWRIGMESYQKFPFMHKLFGFGPDTFGIVTTSHYYDEMLKKYGEIFDSAHNEYLQYLVTMGLAGLVSYIMFLAVSVWEMIHIAAKKQYVMAIVFAVICYGTQAVVNISVPIVTPIMVTLLIMGVSAKE